MISIFIAVQCFQCSTMQVKQQKKVGNTWTCAVCNEKQSVRKVFAQGPMAKELRKFVQKFNMSRQVAEEQALHSPLDEEKAVQDQFPTSPDKKRRSDWSEYLDLEENCSLNQNEKREQAKGDDEFEGRIVTEFPAELFKKPKLNEHLSGSYSGDRDDLLKPVFSKRKKPSAHTNLHDEKLNFEHVTTKNMPRNEQESRSQKAFPSGASKWNKYMTDRDDCEQQKRSERFAIDEGSEINYMLETRSNDEEVKDDIHPDFK